MARLRNSILALALCSCWGAALAQDQGSQSAQADAGFFRPQSGDHVSLVRTLPPETYGEAPKSATQPAVTYVPVPVLVPAAPASESQLDRSEAEAARANALMAAQPHINGAFTGSTDPRDR